ncbi:hypothetical protein RO21_08900 [[Actinobacillus] muris]|uniref:Uncharacterized protein n=1 Tax=Muribacter muris TaxID=67855 RepID=A0A0J5S2H3_9PAST|nr:hypothetical protein [Muribacter muris]KMK51002.1 hypothetical protein RO21_08900 [[Actinobacillus] muris] [Muribacter muris]
MNFTPKLFIDGSEYKVILTNKSCDDLYLSNPTVGEGNLCSQNIKWIHQLDATRMMAYMFRYANGQSLTIPTQLNDERYPFWAFKDKTPPEGVSFDTFRNLCKTDSSLRDKMKHLRAYFWYEMDYLSPNYQEENLIILSHFVIKVTDKMTEEDVAICRNQKHQFDNIKGNKYV